MEKYSKAEAFLLDRFDIFSAPTTLEASLASASAEVPQIIKIENNQRSTVNVPKFSGLALDWESFEQLFTLVVINKE